MKIKVSETTPLQLDYLVAKCEGYDCQFDDESSGPWLTPQEGYLHNEKPLSCFKPSSKWAQGGTIIERHRITISALFAQINPPIPEFDKNEWGAYIPYGTTERGMGAGPTPLIAAMRCFCVSKLGDEVEIPEELL